MNKGKRNIPRKQHTIKSPKNLQDSTVEEIKREVSIQESVHSGPIPSPEALQKYNDIIPDGANRIMKMAENQSSHRISIEKQVVKGQVSQSKWGQILAFVIAMVCLIISWDLAKSGYQAVASIIGGATITGLVYTFIVGRKKQKESLEEKNPE